MLDESLTAEQPEPASVPEGTLVDGEDSDAGATRVGDPRRSKRLEIGERFAGFQIRGELGHGAMGVVYEAWDPTLERRVALKLLRSPSKRAAERLLREARALARLDHPGVVRIWAADVHRGAVYIAMELIEGVNLREWLRAGRSWREILPVMAGAGRGLAAAHAAGVVHRDFKPENVLVGWDGQARVLDFGIAQVSTEQLEREPAEERSDQFGFCVTLFEAIYGSHPFPARSPEELTRKVFAGKVALPDDHHDRAPRWLERVILRGLATKREDRFPTMDALLDALDRHPARRRRRNQALAMTSLLAAAIAVGFAVPSRDLPGPCVDVGDEIEASLGAETRAEIVAHFDAVDRPWARRLGSKMDGALAAWSGRWIEARTGACERRHAHRDATALDEAREACLDEQLRDVAALGAVLREAGVDTLINAERTLLSLPDPTVCLGDEPPPPRRALAGADDLLAGLETLRWLVQVSGEPDLDRRTSELVARARALDASPEARALLAEALRIDGEALALIGESGKAEQELRESERVAERIGADGIRLRAMLGLGFVLASSEGRSDDAVDVLEHADALLERVGAPFNQRVRQRRELAEALLAQGQVQRAKQVAEGLLAEIEQRQEIDSSLAGTTLLTLGRIAATSHDYAGALAYAERVEALYTRELGADHPLLASPLTNQGLALIELGRYPQARVALERSVALRREQAAGANPGPQRRLAEALTNLGNLESVVGNGEQAAAHYREALTLLPKQDELTRSLLLFNLGVDHQIAGRQDQALANYREALRLAERHLPPTHPRVASSRLGIGSMQIALGRPAEAREPLERALADWPDELAGTLDEAELRFALAESLRALDGEGERPRSLAAEARALYEQAGAGDEVARIDAWSGVDPG